MLTVRMETSKWFWIQQSWKIGKQNTKRKKHHFKQTWIRFLPRIEVTAAAAEEEDLPDTEQPAENGGQIWTISENEKKKAKKKIGESIREEIAILGSGLKKVPSKVKDALTQLSKSLRK